MRSTRGGNALLHLDICALLAVKGEGGDAAERSALHRGPKHLNGWGERREEVRGVQWESGGR